MSREEYWRICVDMGIKQPIALTKVIWGNNIYLAKEKKYLILLLPEMD